MRRAVVIFALGLLAASCGKAAAPTAPLVTAPVAAAPVFADFSGVMLVSYKETTCEGHRNCFAYINNRILTVELRLTQSVGSVSGLMIESPTSAVRVSGTVSADGELTLTGSRPRVETFRSGYDSARSIETFKLRRDAEGRGAGTVMLSGDFNEADHGTTGRVKDGGPVTAVDRVQSLPLQSSFAGTWRGRTLTKNCVAITGTYCRGPEPGEMDDFRLTLDASGSVVSGNIAGFAPVTGSASGDTLVLSGDNLVGVQYPTRTTITSWNTYRDGNGELRGSFTYTVESTTYKTSYEMELYFVLLDSSATAAVK